MRFITCAIWVLLLVIETTAVADGIPAYYDDTGWHILNEQAQYAVVALKEGRETLLLQVAIERDATTKQAEKMVWITPVPAPASEVEVDILRGFPMFWGVEPKAFLTRRAQEVVSAMAMTQIYPAFFILYFYTAGAKGSDPYVPGVVIHKHIRRDGVELQLLGADTSEALCAHLKESGVDFPQNGLKSLKPYTGSEACFVVFRIADLEAYWNAIEEAQNVMSLGVEVDFPSENGFYPLVASSALPGERLGIVVTVLGFMTADKPVPMGLSTGHFFGKVRANTEVRRSLGISSTEEKLRYTRFILHAAPKDLTTDLRFRPKTPGYTETVVGWISSPDFGAVLWIIGLVVFAALSVLAGLSARIAWPADARPSYFKVATIGLANFATLVGVLSASILVARRLGIPSRRGILFALLFSAIFCLFLLVLFLLTSVLGV
jgi:hypothetical protein